MRSTRISSPGDARLARRAARLIAALLAVVSLMPLSLPVGATRANISPPIAAWPGATPPSGCAPGSALPTAGADDPVTVSQDASPSRDPTSGYDWPTGKQVPVLRAFQPPAIRWERGHRGVDLALAAGAPVLAAGAGRVAFAGAIGGKGVVAIEHVSGLRTTYEPVQASVAAGQVVARGDPIGVLLPGHCEVQECLHWGAKYGTGRTERYIDPLSLLGRLRYRLVPYDG